MDVKIQKIIEILSDIIDDTNIQPTIEKWYTPSRESSVIEIYRIKIPKPFSTKNLMGYDQFMTSLQMESDQLNIMNYIKSSLPRFEDIGLIMTEYKDMNHYPSYKMFLFRSEEIEIKNVSIDTLYNFFTSESPKMIYKEEIFQVSDISSFRSGLIEINSNIDLKVKEILKTEDPIFVEKSIKYDLKRMLGSFPSIIFNIEKRLFFITQIDNDKAYLELGQEIHKIK